MDKSIGEFLQNGDLSRITTYQAGILQAASHRALQKYCDHVLRRYGITKMQWLIIGCIYDAGDAGVRTTDLARAVGTTIAYMTNSLNLLASRGIIAKRDHRSDSRSKMIHLDAAFARQVEEIEQVLRQALRDTIYKNVSLEDFRTYMKVLYKLSRTENN